jgi:hypothetical protein
MKLIFIITSLFLCSCTVGRDRGGVTDHTTVTHVADFSRWVPAIDMLCAVGIAAAFAALIWVPIQRWIPMAGITFFGCLIVTAHTVAWLVEWMPYLIAGGMFTGALWTIWHFRSVIIGIKQGWDSPETAADPTVIAKILLRK